tara:strand:+ start:520247 stop:520447 length:201 start_codon:yes stop_codon:yes gene_type:complete
MSAAKRCESDERARGLLQEICADQGLSPDLVEDLLAVERQHIGMARRRGLYDRLNECLAAHEGGDE